MNESPPSTKSTASAPGFKLSKGWIATLVLLFFGYLLLKPWLEERFHTQLPGFGETYVAKAETSNQPAPDLSSGTAISTEAESLEELLADNVDAGKSVEPIEVASTVEVDEVREEPKPVTPAPATKAEENTTQKPEVTAPATAKTDEKPKSAEPELGKLRDLGNKVYVSTAGLRYKPGSADGHRLVHVLKHGEDNPDKEIHGVFTGDKQVILKLIDEAYLLAQKGKPPQVKIEDEGERIVYTVDMKKKIGYVGGSVGKRKRNPGCTKLRLVLEGTDVITAFPVDR